MTPLHDICGFKNLSLTLQPHTLLHVFSALQDLLHSIDSVLIPKLGVGVTGKGTAATSHRKVLNIGGGEQSSRLSFQISQAGTDTAGAVATAASGQGHAKDATAVGSATAAAVASSNGHRKILNIGGGQQSSRLSFQISQAGTDTAGAIATAASGQGHAKDATAVGSATAAAVASSNGHRKILNIGGGQQRSRLSFQISQAGTDTAGAIATAASGQGHAKDATAVGSATAAAVASSNGHRKILNIGGGQQRSRLSFQISQAGTDTAGAIATAASGQGHAKDATAVGSATAAAVASSNGHRKILDIYQ